MFVQISSGVFTLSSFFTNDLLVFACILVIACKSPGICRLLGVYMPFGDSISLCK